MGTLNVNTLKSETLTGKSVASSIAVTAEGGSITTNLQQGLVKCWCYWETTDTVRDSFNSSGLTDNGTGDATYSYTNNMANDDYASFFVGNGREYESPLGSNATSGQQTGHRNSSGDMADTNKLSGGVVGDLA